MSFIKLLLSAGVLAILGIWALFSGDNQGAVSLFSAGFVLQAIAFSLKDKS